jgi:hypothetical protein
MTLQDIATSITVNAAKSDEGVFPPESPAVAKPTGSTASIAMTAAIPQLFKWRSVLIGGQHNASRVRVSNGIRVFFLIEGSVGRRAA